MKAFFTTTLVTIFSLVSLFAVAQAPKDGAMLKLDQAKVKLESGGEVSVTIEVIRSKRFQKSKIGAPSLASSVKGMTEHIAVAEQPDVYVLTLEAEDGVVTGTHTLVVNGDRRWGRKIRSSILTVEIVNVESPVSSKQ